MTKKPAEELVEMLPRLRRYAMTLSHSESEVDDLVQTTCVRALANMDTWVPGTRFDSWLFRILHNHWIDTIRHSRVQGVQDELENHELAGSDGEAVAMSRIDLADLKRSIDVLPPEQREVLLLVCVEDLAYREAADVLGIPVGTVMSRLARARQKLIELTGR